VPGERQPSLAARGDQGAFVHPRVVLVLEPFELEIVQVQFEPIGDRQVAHRAAAVDAHEVLGEVGDEGERVHAGTPA
jgi:hypothetical protein